MKRKVVKRGTNRRRESGKMKGTLGRLLQVQLHHHQSSSANSSSLFARNLLDSEPDDPSTSASALDLDAADDKDFILSQDFFCTPDYITPDNQNLMNGFDCNKDNIPCPKSPEKLHTLKSKRPRQGFFPAIIGGDGLSRYHTDFHEIEQIGTGNFSRVFKVLKRIDGCLYAVKHTTRQLHQDTERRKALMEVQALAALGSHENIVGYYSSWFENEQLYIQMELCDYSLSRNTSLQLFTEGEVLRAWLQIAKALQCIHERGIAHLDVKPDNIYVKNGAYKLGDFGCATLLNKSLPIEEGDARYMPQEILNENYDHLDKVDIFSLGVTIYELIRGSPLQESGRQFLREGKLPLLPGHSIQFQNLLKVMVDQDPVRRPSAKELIENPIFDKVSNNAKA
ncbi:Kinase WEE1 isoform 2 [Theobroma cacao]|uniref:Wee1-like protein kinase n=1 Tax=Theobroma cacao TaxID=3641 RepID=A0A061DQA5_THECC|nr:Kinase WEE1 isoform 2 [Theobroma cacao]